MARRVSCAEYRFVKVDDSMALLDIIDKGTPDGGAPTHHTENTAPLLSVAVLVFSQKTAGWLDAVPHVGLL